jgi:hypothetical protein
VDGIRAAVDRVLGYDAYRTTARRIAEEMRALPPADDFFDAYSDDQGSRKSAKSVSPPST